MSDGSIPLERLYQDQIQTGIEEGGKKVIVDLVFLIGMTVFAIWLGFFEAPEDGEWNY